MYNNNESEEELPFPKADLGSCYFTTSARDSPKCRKDSIYKRAARWVKCTTLGMFPLLQLFPLNCLFNFCTSGSVIIKTEAVR